MFLVENDIASLYNEMLESEMDVLEIKAIETLGNIIEKCGNDAFDAFIEINFMTELIKFHENSQYLVS